MAENHGISWSRVFVEGVVVVLSILLALAVDEWREAARDDAIEREALTRLLLDLDANLGEIDPQHRAQASQLASARLVYPLVSRGDWRGLDTAVAVRAAYYASPSPTPTWARDTFDEMNSSGRMALIGNTALRAEIVIDVEATEIPAEWIG